MTFTDPPSFASYLVSSFSLPRRRPSFRKNRHSSTPSPSSSLSTTTSSSAAIFSPPGSTITSSSSSSTATTPSTSPPTIKAAYLAQKESPSLADDDTYAGYKLHRARSDHLKCSTCATDLAFTSQIISKAFTGRYGRAYLVSPPTSNRNRTYGSAGTQEQCGNLVNISVGQSVNRQLATGAHVVADISCAICRTVVGWKYVDAYDEGQKYKIGKFILETKRVAVMRGWEDVDVDGDRDVDFACGRGWGGGRRGGRRGDFDVDVDESGIELDDEEEEEVRFNSDDEDECDEIFAGTWDREAVLKRRGGRRIVSG